MAARPAPSLDHGTVPWLLVCALATAGPHAGHLPWWLSLYFLLLSGWRARLWYLRSRLPPRRLLAIALLGGIAGIGWQFHTVFGRDAGVALLVLLMALKPMEMNDRRDALVIVMLGFFLLLTHYFYSQDIPTGLWLLATTTLLTATLIRLHGGEQPCVAIMRRAGMLVAQGIPFMLILFLLFPRVSGPLWGLPQDAYSGVSGLTDHLSPGSLNHLILSGAIAMRVRFIGDLPEKSDLYWRGPVFDAFDGSTWRARPLRNALTLEHPLVEVVGRLYAYVSIIEPHSQRWLLALDMPTDRPSDSLLDPTLTVMAREPLRTRSRFSFASTVTYRANAIEAAPILEQALALPADVNPRARALAGQWMSRPPDRIVDTALALFRDQNFSYTLRPPLLGNDGVDEFLFDTRRGFCEHYASAFVFLMRAAGVPARIVAGYQGGEINPIDGYLTVRQSDAHAWAEVWIARRGWVRVDPTAAVAPSRIEQGIVAALPASEPLPAIVRIDVDWLRQLRNRWEAANNAWNQWVLGYNPQRQRDFLSRLGWPSPDWQSMTGSLAVLCGVMLLAVALWALPRRVRIDPALRVWQAYCARLAQQGVERAHWEGPLAFAERVAHARPDLAALTRMAARHYAELRYGQGNVEQLRLLEQCLQQLPRLRRRRT